MGTPKKYILLNAGTQTRNAFRQGLGDTPFEWYHTKNMLLYIDAHGVPSFIYKNRKVDFTDADVFTRLRANDQQFCGILYDYFTFAGISATDPINCSYVNSAEKISQMLLLALAKIPIPETLIFREESYEMNRTYVHEHLSFPLIFKTDGSRGRNVMFVKNIEDLDAHVENKRPHERALVQPFIENEFDTRTIIAFGTILGTIKRARTDGYLNNIAQGAVASLYELTEEERALAIHSASVCGIDVAGVDMIHTENGPLILEVNKSPQIHGFESVHKFKVFERVAELMKKR